MAEMRIAGNTTNDRDQETLAQVATIHRYLCDLRHAVAEGSNASTVFAPLPTTRRSRPALHPTDFSDRRPRRGRLLDFP